MKLVKQYEPGDRGTWRVDGDVVNVAIVKTAYGDGDDLEIYVKDLDANRSWWTSHENFTLVTELPVADFTEEVIDPEWHHRQLALAYAVDLGKATLAAGGTTDSDLLVKVAAKFEEYLRG